jgi:CIC family chloride channel protein
MNGKKFHLPRLLDRLEPTSTTVLLVTAILVGAGTGLGAVVFIRLIEWIQRLFYESLAQPLESIGRWLFVIAPVVGGLTAGPIIAYFASEAKGHGVPEVMQAIALHGGRIRPRVGLAKIAASALCIGSGGSAGREGPIVQVGAALGSTLGQLLHFSEGRIRNLVACGAAAGIAATFNAPIAGVVFSMEIILGELNLGDLGSVIISAVTASTIARVFLGERPAFTIPHYGMQSPLEIFLYAFLGLLSAITAIGFIRLLYWFEDRFDAWKFPMSLKPAVGGLLLGGLAYIYPMVLGLGFVPEEETMMGVPLYENVPHVFGAGFPVIQGALLGELSFGLLFLLVFLKPLATSLTLGSGNSGGVFAPSLFTGAALGGAFGRVVERVAPLATAGPGAFATVGMAAVFAGAARAPFTAILIVFEMTDDYRLIIPLMAGVIVSIIVAERLFKDSIYTLKLTRRGIRLQRGRDLDVMEAVRADEVMMQPPVTIPANLPASLLANEFLRTGRHGFPVLNEDGTLLGVVSLEDYRRALSMGEENMRHLSVRDIATRHVVTAFPDETVGAILRRMAPRDLSRLPVVKREDPRQLVGVVRRNDIVRAYELGVVRREEARRRAERIPEVDPNQAEFVDIPLIINATTIGKQIRDLNLPRASVLVAIRRDRELVIPHGDTYLQPGDVITALCQHNSIEELRGKLNAIPTAGLVTTPTPPPPSDLV